MKIAVAGGDARFAALRELLIARGFGVTDDLASADYIVTNYPYRVPVPAGVPTVCCGPEFAPDGEFDIMRDETYLVDVADLTAEGALASATAAAGCALCGARCLVVGWGRIGRALTELLVCLGAEVTVLSRRESTARDIALAGARSQPTADAGKVIPGHRFVFSTPPHMVLNEEVLKNADKNAVIIDLASPPYGVDLKAANKLGLRAWREPGLPGRYCPENAAATIFRAMERGGILN